MLDESQKALLYAKYGLDQPIVIQFFRYVFNMLKGDFGVSYTISKNTPISQLIAMRLPVSLKIGGQAILIGTLIGLAFGIIAAIKHNTIWDTLTTIISVIGVSAPFKSSILPSIALRMFTIASIARFTRSEMLEVLASDYIRFAESKGISGVVLIVRHGIRNALVPIITVLAPLIVGLMTGSLVVEKIFSIPGFGSLLVTAIQSNDYNVIIALSFIYSAMYIAIMLVVDILYGFVDPKDCSSAWSDHQYGWCGNHDYRHGACSGEYGGSSG